VQGFLARHPARVPGLARVLPALLGFAAHRLDRGQLKSALIRATLGGASRAEVDSWSAGFVPRLLERGMRRDALAALEAHRAHGDRLVLMSASVDLYVPSIARALDMAETICTAVRWNGASLDGALASANRRGAEKARCLKELRERHPGCRIVAYGNAASDLGHLCLADRGVLVNGAPHTRRAAARLGLECVRWR
jgi:phosphatidylglycerophosphatase C